MKQYLKKFSFHDLTLYTYLILGTLIVLIFNPKTFGPYICCQNHVISHLEAILADGKSRRYNSSFEICKYLNTYGNLSILTKFQLCSCRWWMHCISWSAAWPADLLWQWYVWRVWKMQQSETETAAVLMSKSQWKLWTKDEPDCVKWSTGM